MIPSQSKQQLFLLSFGESTAITGSSRADLTQKLKFIGVEMSIGAPASSISKFSYKIATLNLNGLKLAALSTTPCQFEIKKTDDILLIIPFVGRSKIETANARYEWQASEVALLLPGGTYSGVSTQSSVLIINFDPVRLGLSADTMQSCEKTVDWQYALSAVRKIDMQVHNIFIDKIFQQLCTVIDQMAEYPEFLGKSGLEESFYRAIALAIKPAMLGKEPDKTKTQNYARRKVDSVCQYIKAHIAHEFTLADLDRISGMSRRSLHYEFQKRYLCAPMKWVRSERLRQAHDKLRRSVPSTTVTSLAIACGFSSPAIFANHYKKQYGEHPGTVLDSLLKRKAGINAKNALMH